MEHKPNPLVKNFQDVAFRIVIRFTNDSHQDRASLPTYGTTMISKKMNDSYVLQCKYPHRLQSFIKDYSITGEYNLEIMIGALGYGLTQLSFAYATIIEKDMLRDFVSKNSLGKKETNLDLVYLATDVFFSGIMNDDVFPAKITLKKNRGGLTPMYFEVELPCELCDQWYELFAKYDYQVSKGPKLI